MPRVITIALIALTLGVGIRTAAQAQTSLVPSNGQEQTAPTLIVEKTSDVTNVAPGDIITFTVSITNTGTGPALGVQLNDTMPVGFSLTTTGQNTYAFDFLGSLEPGQAFSTSYSANIAADVANGEYVNIATVRATNHTPVSDQSTVTVKAPEVKGAATQKTSTRPTGAVLGAADELPATGVGQLDVFLALLGSGFFGAGLLGLRRRS